MAGTSLTINKISSAAHPNGWDKKASRKRAEMVKENPQFEHPAAAQPFLHYLLHSKTVES